MTNEFLENRALLIIKVSFVPNYKTPSTRHLSPNLFLHSDRSGCQAKNMDCITGLTIELSFYIYEIEDKEISYINLDIASFKFSSY